MPVGTPAHVAPFGRWTTAGSSGWQAQPRTGPAKVKEQDGRQPLAPLDVIAARDARGSTFGQRTKFCAASANMIGAARAPDAVTVTPVPGGAGGIVLAGSGAKEGQRGRGRGVFSADRCSPGTVRLADACRRTLGAGLPSPGRLQNQCRQ